jgi:hypothetical protein
MTNQTVSAVDIVILVIALSVVVWGGCSLLDNLLNFVQETKKRLDALEKNLGVRHE